MVNIKVLIIGHAEKNYLPYLDRYTKFFDANEVNYDIVYWHREEAPTAIKANEFYFTEKTGADAISKIIPYLKYAKFVRKIIKGGQYDKLVVLSTMPAFFLRKTLYGMYKGRYLFDYRDFSYENLKFFKKRVVKLVNCSELTTISSPGFKEYLGENEKFVINHNLILDAPVSTPTPLKGKPLINIGYIGGVRYYETNVMLLEKLKNIFTYQLWYIGQPHSGCDLESYCKDAEITNVSFMGKYNNEQKADLYKNIDIINALYGSNSLEVITLLPNRLYEACIYRKPIITSKDTYLSRIVSEYKLGLIIDIEVDDVAEKIGKYIETFDEKVFAKACDNFIDEVKKDETTLYSYLKGFIK